MAKDATSLVLDGAGFIPGEGAVETVAQTTVGIVSTVNSAADKDVPGALGSIMGMHLVALAPVVNDVSQEAAKAVPLAGTVVNIGLTVRDIDRAAGDYQSCRGVQ